MVARRTRRKEGGVGGLGGREVGETSVIERNNRDGGGVKETVG